MKRTNFNVPWMGFMCGLLLMLYMYLFINPDLIGFYQLPPAYFKQEFVLYAMGGFMTIVLFDVFRFGRKKRRYDKRMADYEAQLEELLKNKSKLQHKVHKYSAHADKLKLFISDRLLEYIEYDEKFLHFKNIASEVRHTGVICFDKVTTSLKSAIEKEAGNSGYQDALDSMGYLWDLLDLSTADNISMYIANKLYKAEEHYYQQVLSEEGFSLYSPTFLMRRAVIKTLRGFSGGQELPALPGADEKYRYKDDRFYVEMDDVGEMLGNENYVVLMLENLINNALYYGDVKKYQSEYSKIVVRLMHDDGAAKVSVYNRGPLVDDEIKGKIFQLGFSTKRIRENNGKGLGLYFVSEIVKGYEGELNFENIINKAETYLLRFVLENGDEVVNTVIVDVDDKQRPMCRSPEDGSLNKDSKFKFKERVISVELTKQSTQEKHQVLDIGKEDSEVIDPFFPERPEWSLQLKPARNGCRVLFKPLDISGVQFNVYLPTAASRLDSSYHDIEGDAFDDLDELDKGLEAVKDYVG